MFYLSLPTCSNLWLKNCQIIVMIFFRNIVKNRKCDMGLIETCFLRFWSILRLIFFYRNDSWATWYLMCVVNYLQNLLIEKKLIIFQILLSQNFSWRHFLTHFSCEMKTLSPFNFNFFFSLLAFWKKFSEMHFQHIVGSVTSPVKLS